MQRPPVVHLVGAGPGDPELLTLKAYRLLQQADVVVHDRLVGSGVLALIPRQVRRIDVGKAPGAHRLAQEEINALLAERARAGEVVVRLKGGDPFLFGRGGEEALYLLERGIHVEVVPGITAAFACAARNRVPLTHRGIASGVRFVTGHRCGQWWQDLDWEGLADPATTLVVYMGLADVEKVTARLREAGLDPLTPVLAVENGTLPEERTVESTLHRIAPAVRRARLRAPVLFIIGEVVRVLRDLAPARPPAVAAAGHWIERVLHA